MKYILPCLLVVVCLSSSIGAQQSLAVTIYNDDFAMVKDVREISFEKGNSFLYFTDVSANIQTQTVTFKAINKPDEIRVFEQNFEKNLVNTDSILNKYIEKQIDIYVQLGNQVQKISGKLLGHNSGYILQTDFGINVYKNVVGFQFPSLPDGFFTTPTLNWKVYSQSQITTPCEVAYRTTGFSWKADYSINLNQDESKGDIGGWVTIDNNSGKKYVNAKLKLIAGDVHTVEPKIIPSGFPVQIATADALIVDDEPSFSEKSFADYHLYTLSTPVTLNQQSQKQVEFIPKVYSLPVRKYYEIRIGSGGRNQLNLDATNKIDFLNQEENGLGIPFPKGIVRVFKEDEDDGSLEFIGEDSIDHTPKNEQISITTGNAFDIVANKYAQKRENTDNLGSYRAELNMTIKNHKETEAQVVIIYSNYYNDNLEITWEDNDVSLEKKTSSEYRWKKVLSADEVWTTEWVENYQR